MVTSLFTNSQSMRSNYETYGVEDYYRQVCRTYRNPHGEGVTKVVKKWMDAWWGHEGMPGAKVLDLAAGSGEVTVALKEWEQQVRKKDKGEPLKDSEGGDILDVSATDPYTSPAYSERTKLPCHILSFRDVSNGLLPDVYSIVICSFALHLVEPSELFSVLWELSTRAKWLVVVAPGKKPEIRDGRGWVRWNVDQWDLGTSELIYQKCRGRVYRSTQVISQGVV